MKERRQERWNEGRKKREKGGKKGTKALGRINFIEIDLPTNEKCHSKWNL